LCLVSLLSVSFGAIGVCVAMVGWALQRGSQYWRSGSRRQSNQYSRRKKKLYCCEVSHRRQGPAGVDRLMANDDGVGVSADVNDITARAANEPKRIGLRAGPGSSGPRRLVIDMRLRRCSNFIRLPIGQRIRIRPCNIGADRMGTWMSSLTASFLDGWRCKGHCWFRSEEHVLPKMKPN
jgi:hypothetical protein